MLKKSEQQFTSVDRDLLNSVRRSAFSRALEISSPTGVAISDVKINEVLDLLEKSPPDWDAQGDAMLNELDRRLTECIDSSVSNVLHHPTVCGLRRRWSAVESLFAEPSLPGDFQLYILQATPAGLTSQLMAAGGSIEETRIYKHLSLATYGGTPFLVIEFDAELGAGKINLDMLDLVARLGESGMFISLVNVGPAFLGLEDFSDMPTTSGSVRKMFNTEGVSHYSEFRKQFHSRFVAPCFPAVYAVTPFSCDENPAAGFDFTEIITSEADLVPVGAASAMLQCIARSMGEYGWPAAIVGEDWGGKVAGLTLRKFSTETGEEARNATTQMIIHETVEMPLTENGITALVAKLDKTIACFFAGATASRAIKGLDPKKSKESAMAASLPNMLITLRFGHYLKALHRKLLGSQKCPADIEADLRTWVNGFVLDQENASDAAKAERPFRSIEVSVQADSDQPGYLSVSVQITPHFRVSAVQGQLTITAD